MTAVSAHPVIAVILLFIVFFAIFFLLIYGTLQYFERRKSKTQRRQSIPAGGIASRLDYKTCPKCGTSMPGIASFCPECGSQQIAA